MSGERKGGGVMWGGVLACGEMGGGDGGGRQKNVGLHLEKSRSLSGG